MPEAPKKVAVFGLGRVSMGDDGVGSHAVHRLHSRFNFPPEIEVADLGVPGPRLVDRLLGLDALIVIESIYAGGEPGEVLLFRRHDLLSAPLEARLSARRPLLRDALIRVDLRGDGPRDVLLIGIVARSVEPSTELTRRIRRALPRVEVEVMKELARLGHPAQPLDEPVVSVPWWERGAS